MSKYGPTVNPGDTRVRLWRMQIENPLTALPYMKFHENEVIQNSDGDEKELDRTRDIDLPYDPDTAAGKMIQIRNPEDDSDSDLFGETEISLEDVYKVLYSLGRYAQEEQDIKDNPTTA